MQQVTEAVELAEKSFSHNFVDQPAYVRNNIDQLVGRMFTTSGMTVNATGVLIILRV